MSQVNPSAFPFHKPQLRMNDWNTELFATENCAVLMPGQPTSEDNLDHLLRNPRVPILAFTGTLHQELRYLARSIPDTEWAVFLTLKRLSATQPHFLAFDWFMSGQTASGAEVAMDAADAQRYYEALKDVDYYRENGLHQHLCHLHSHGSMHAFFSSIDNEQMFTRSELGFYGPFRFYVVVNARGDIKVSLVNYDPVLFRTDAVAALVFSRPEYAQPLTAARKAEIDQVVKAMLRKKQPGRRNNVVIPAAGSARKQKGAAKGGNAPVPSGKKKLATMDKAMNHLLGYLAGMGPSMAQPGADELADTDPQGRPLGELQDELYHDPNFVLLVKDICRRLSLFHLNESDLAHFLSACILEQEDEISCQGEEIARETADYLHSLALILIQTPLGDRMPDQYIEKMMKDTYLSPATVRAARSMGANSENDALYRSVRNDFDALLAGKKPQDLDDFVAAFPKGASDIRRTA